MAAVGDEEARTEPSNLSRVQIDLPVKRPNFQVIDIRNVPKNSPKVFRI